MIIQINEMLISMAEQSKPKLFVILCCHGILSPHIPIKTQEVIF